MTVIRGSQLTSYAVAPDGESFSINVTDVGGRPASLVLPSDCLNELMMTLPEIVRRSLQARFRDQAMRVVYPVGSWVPGAQRRLRNRDPDPSHAGRIRGVIQPAPDRAAADVDAERLDR